MGLISYQPTIGPSERNPFFEQPWWFYLIAVSCMGLIYLYAWLCSRNAARWLGERKKHQILDRLPDGRKPYEWTEGQMDEAEASRIDDGAQVDRLLCLQEENRQLKTELHRLRDWPEELVESPEAYRSIIGW